MARQEAIHLHGPFTELERTLKSGAKRRRLRIDVDATPVVHVFDDKRLGKAPAEAIKAVLGDLLIQRAGPVHPETRKAREKQLRAFRAGKPWAVKRFQSARLKNTAPKESQLDKAWMFSGRFARGLAVQEDRDKKTWRINVPANRLSRNYAQTAGEYQKLLNSLSNQLPELGQPALLLQHARVKQAVETSIAGLIAVARNELEAKRLERTMALVDLAAPAALAGLIRLILTAHRSKRAR